MRSRRRRLFGWLAVGLVVALAAGVAVRIVRTRAPAGVLVDVRAGMAARSIRDPDQRLAKYLEGRYGSLDDPAVRRRIFLDFFDLERINALQWLVRHAPAERRQESVDAMSRWVSRYRDSLSADERAELGTLFRTPEGRAMLGRATAQYNSQDVQYRGQTAGVISQLLRTLHEVQQDAPVNRP